MAISAYTDRAGRTTGRFLSNFSYVLTTLVIYLVICFITFLAVRISLGPEQGPSFIAYEITTGGDPFNFKELAAPHPVLWVWILFVHTLSWLLVPVLAATAIDAAYRSWEQRMEELEAEVQGEMRGVLERHAGLENAEADEIAQKLWNETRKKLAIRTRKG